MQVLVQVYRRIVLRKKNEQQKSLQEMKTSWDKNLVDQLIDEFPIKLKELRALMRDKHGILNRNIIIQKYGNLLKYSDIFGLPVWALIKEETVEEVMPSVKDEIDKNIQPFRVCDLEEILNYISVQTETLTLSNDDRTHVSLMVDTLKNILKRHERWSETWRMLLSINKDQLKKHKDYNYTCNLLFTYNSEVIYRGTLRFYKKPLKDSTKPLSLKDSFKTSWFFIKKMVPSAKKPRLILSIVDDISTEIFDCQQPNISLNTENDNEMLFCWNTNYKKTGITIPDLTSNFRDRMRNLNKISAVTVFNINEFFYRNEFEQTRSLEEDTSSKNQTMDTSSRIRTLDFLLINGYINSGDCILFKDGEDSYNDEFAEIIIANNKTMLLWRGDIYHFTILTNNLLVNRLIETPPNYCAKYWYLPGRQYSLYQLANFVKMIHKF